MNRLQSLINKSPSESIISSYEYSYDAGGRRTKAVLANGEITYSCDNANQLTGENRSGSHSAYTISYNYDSAGNRTQMVKDGVT